MFNSRVLNVSLRGKNEEDLTHSICLYMDSIAKEWTALGLYSGLQQISMWFGWKREDSLHLFVMVNPSSFLVRFPSKPFLEWECHCFRFLPRTINRLRGGMNHWTFHHVTIVKVCLSHPWPVVKSSYPPVTGSSEGNSRVGTFRIHSSYKRAWWRKPCAVQHSVIERLNFGELREQFPTILLFPCWSVKN